MPASQTAAAPGRVFLTTHWSVVLAAQHGTAVTAANALETLCRHYWYPLYAYVRRRGHAPHDAQDLTQGFFCRLLEKQWLDAADREKGKLRSFLITALKYYMANEWRHAATQRHGGAHELVQFDTSYAEDRLTVAPPPGLTADATYDREWALLLLERTVERLRAGFAAAGRAQDFDALKDCLMAERGALDYAAIAVRLGATAGAARVAVHRLRKQFREVFRAEIAQTLAPDGDIEEEMRHLAAALSAV